MILKVPNCGMGVNIDAMPEELPLGVWSAATNVRFRNGFAERSRGLTQVFTAPSITPYYLAPFASATTKYWVHAGTNAVYVDDGTTRTDITGTAPTGTTADRWTGGSLNGILVMNNGVDQPMYWDGNTANNLVTLTGWDANERAKVIRPWRNYLFALQVKKTATWYPHMVKWSSAADPGTPPASWDETNPANDAGELDLAETPDLLVDCLPFGESLIIYKERSAFNCRYIGGQFIFQFSRIPGDVGMLAPGCGVQIPNGQVIMTNGDIVLFNGGGFQSIAENVVRREIFDTLDSTNYASSFVTVNPQRNEVWVCYPVNGSSTCNRAAVWNWTDNAWGFRDLPNVTYGNFGQISYAAASTTWADTETWEQDSSAWGGNEYSPNEARLLFSHSTPRISLADTGSSDFGTAISASIERRGMAFDDGQGVKIVRGIWPRFDAPAGTVVSIEVGATMTPDALPSYSTPVNFTVGTDSKVDTFASGRFAAVRISSTSYGPWRLRSFDIDAVPAGQF